MPQACTKSRGCTKYFVLEPNNPERSKVTKGSELRYHIQGGRTIQKWPLPDSDCYLIRKTGRLFFLESQCCGRVSEQTKPIEPAFRHTLAPATWPILELRRTSIPATHQDSTPRRSHLHLSFRDRHPNCQGQTRPTSGPSPSFAGQSLTRKDGTNGDRQADACYGGSIREPAHITLRPIYSASLRIPSRSW